MDSILSYLPEEECTYDDPEISPIEIYQICALLTDRRENGDEDVEDHIDEVADKACEREEVKTNPGNSPTRPVF